MRIFTGRDNSLECGDLSPLFALGGLPPIVYALSTKRCRDKSRLNKAVTGHRTPKTAQT